MLRAVRVLIATQYFTPEIIAAAGQSHRGGAQYRDDGAGSPAR